MAGTQPWYRHAFNVPGAVRALATVALVSTHPAPQVVPGALLVSARFADASVADSGIRVVVSIGDRTLSVLHGRDTVRQVQVGVATGMTLSYGGHAWRFRTPSGERHVLRKLRDPVWVPPDWHYAEVALEYGLRLARLPARGTTLSGGKRLTIRNGIVGLIRPGDHFRELPTDEHIVFDGRLFIPPVGTANRRITGDLGRFALDLGDGYLIHGTTDEASVGEASTHGCIRARDADLVWLYDNVPVGTPVVIR